MPDTPLEDDNELLTILLVHQGLLERYKLSQKLQIDKRLSALTPKIRGLLRETEREMFRDFTRKELGILTRRLIGVQEIEYDIYRKSQLYAFQNLSEIELRGVSALIGQSVTKSADTMWAYTRNLPLMPTGETLTRSLNNFIDDAIVKVNQEIMRGYAASATINEVSRNIIGTKSANYRDGLFARIKKWSDALTDGIIQHISSTVSENVFSSAYDNYQWVAMFDSDTCPVCEGLNGEYFHIGEGPRPPQHYNCRCTIIPIVGTERVIPKFDDWLDEQPPSFLDMLLGKQLTLVQYETELKRLASETQQLAA